MGRGDGDTDGEGERWNGDRWKEKKVMNFNCLTFQKIESPRDRECKMKSVLYNKKKVRSMSRGEWVWRRGRGGGVGAGGTMMIFAKKPALNIAV